MRRLLIGLLFACGVAHAAARFEDTIAQRTLACTQCHGQSGRAASDGYYPRIAGKPAGYLYNQLLNFRDGRRRYALMTTLIDPLSDDYLREIADYFGALDLPYPPHQPVTAPADVLQRGEQLVLRGDAARQLPSCVQCHGQAMTGVAPAIPGLLGLPVDYLIGQLGPWKIGNRRTAAPDCMAQIVQRMRPKDSVATARCLPRQPVAAQSKQASALPQALPISCGVVVQVSKPVASK